DGAGGGHVPRGIPDHHHPAFRERHVQMGGTALGPDPDELGPVLVVAAEAAEAKGSEKAHALELEARAFPHVARAQADRVSLSLRGLPDGTLHAGVNPACGGALEFFLQVPEVDGEEVVDLGLGRLDPDPGERGADDGPVGHPVEGEGEAVAACVSAGKGPLDGPPGRPSGGDQRAVDVEEEDGRPQLSPRPKSAVPSSRGSNGRRSARDSPTPTRRTGIWNSSAMPMTTPPFAVPSSLVRAMPVTPSASWNCRACWMAFCPMVASRTRRISSGAPSRALPMTR